MKKITSIALLTVLLVGAAVAQKPVNRPISPMGRSINSMRIDKSADLVMNEKGLDKISLGSKFKPELSALPLYDHIEKAEESKKGENVIKLMAKDKEMGRVTVSDGVVSEIYLTSPDVHLENGIRRGMPMAEVLGMDEVTAELEYNPDNKEVMVVVKYHNISIECITEKDLSDQGLKKVSVLRKNIEKNEAGKKASPVNRLKPDDINPELHVSGFKVTLER